MRKQIVWWVLSICDTQRFAHTQNWNWIYTQNLSPNIQFESRIRNDCLNKFALNFVTLYGILFMHFNVRDCMNVFFFSSCLQIKWMENLYSFFIFCLLNVWSWSVSKEKFKLQRCAIMFSCVCFYLIPILLSWQYSLIKSGN